MLALPRLVYNNKLALPSLPAKGTFQDKTIIVTGASGGIGLATAAHYVNLGASTVIITARTVAKGEAAKATIEAQTGTIGKNVVKVIELDMSTFASTKLFADRVTREVKTIDCVLLNAGMLATRSKIGKEGFEESIEVNTLSTALLGILLLPWMKEAGKGKAHLVFVTSGLHRGVAITQNKFPQMNVLDFFSKPENWPKGGMYPVNKLLEQYCVNEIAKLAIGQDGSPKVIVNSMCPGMVKSDLAREYKTNVFISILADIFMTLIMKNTEAGARSLVLASTTTSSENGKYYTNYQSDEDYEKAVQHNILGEDGKKMQALVWGEVVNVLGRTVPEVREIVSVSVGA